MAEDEFIDHIMDRYTEKKRYADFLENEGSIMAETSRANQGVFRLRGVGQSSPDAGSGSD